MNNSVQYSVSVIDFVKEMENKHDYPLFADNISVDKVYSQNATPSTPTIDGSLTPPLAKFTTSIVFEVFENAAK